MSPLGDIFGGPDEYTNVTSITLISIPVNKYKVLFTFQEFGGTAFGQAEKVRTISIKAPCKLEKVKPGIQRIQMTTQALRVTIFPDEIVIE